MAVIKKLKPDEYSVARRKALDEIDKASQSDLRHFLRDKK